MKYVECYPEQKLSDKYPNARVDWNLNAEQRAFLKKLMKDTGVQMKSYGCTMKSPRPVAELEAQVKNVCEFAADMGVEQVQTEAKFCEIPMWLKYAKKTRPYNRRASPRNRRLQQPVLPSRSLGGFGRPL